MASNGRSNGAGELRTEAGQESRGGTIEHEVNRGKGKLGPVGSLAEHAGLVPVEFEARYHRELRAHAGGLPVTSHTECIGLSIVACDGSDIPPGEYHLHAEYDGTSETMRVSNQTGESHRLSLNF